MKSDYIAPKDIQESAAHIKRLEQELDAAREKARERIRTHYSRGASARQLSDVYGGPFSYVTTLKVIDRMLQDTDEVERKAMSRVQTSIF